MQQITSKSSKTFSSDNCILYTRNIYAAITLWSLFTNLNDNEICAKKFDQVFKKINTFSFVDKNEHLWYDSYIVLQKENFCVTNYVLEKQKSWCKIFYVWCEFFLTLILKRWKIVNIKKKKIENKYHSGKSEKFKTTINFSVYIFSSLRKNVKIKTKFIKFIKYIIIIK